MTANVRIYRDVTEQVMERLRQRAGDQGFSLPSDDSGSFEVRRGPLEITGELRYDRAHSTLELEIRSKPFFISYGQIGSAVDPIVSECGGTLVASS